MADSKDIESKQIELILRYFDNQLSEQEATDFANRLKLDKAFQSIFVEVSTQRGNLSEVFRMEDSFSAKEPARKRPAPRTRILAPPAKRPVMMKVLAVAATLIFALGAVFIYRITNRPQAAPEILATLIPSKGIAIEKADKSQPKNQVNPGDSLVLQAGAKISIRYPDGTAISLRDKSRLTFNRTSDGSKQMKLAYGRLEAEVTKQTRGLSVQTPDSTITVLGTAFQVEVEGKRTKLMVHEGVVRFRRQDGKAIQVIAGQTASTDAPLFRATPIETALDKGLMAWWRFEETSGTILKDSSSNGIDLKLTGKGFSIAGRSEPGRIGRCLRFDGDNDEAIHDTFLDTMPKELTVAAWVKPDATGMFADQCFITKHNRISSDQFWCTFGMDGDQPGEVYLSFRRHGKFRRLKPRITWQDQTWIHYAMTWNSDGIRLYINGKEVASNDTPGTFADGNAGEFTIGSGSARRLDFKGCLDDLRIYNRALTATEIRELHRGSE